jgi:hypothetical protein
MLLKTKSSKMSDPWCITTLVFLSIMTACVLMMLLQRYSQSLYNLIDMSISDIVLTLVKLWIKQRALSRVELYTNYISGSVSLAEVACCGCLIWAIPQLTRRKVCETMLRIAKCFALEIDQLANLEHTYFRLNLPILKVVPLIILISQ